MKAVIGTSQATGEKVRYETIAEACRQGGFDPDCISLCINGLARHHAGFEWVEEGHENRPPQVSPKVRQAAELRNAGHGNRELADIMGISYCMARVYAGRATTAGLCQPLKRGVAA
ncbi:MAG: hypothetical protein ACRC8R_12045 [Aeromonas hydrophila]